jgi:DNA-binding beta-propeller fold protein YncE
MLFRSKPFHLFLAAFMLFLLGAKDNKDFLGPYDIISSPDGAYLYIAQKEAHRIDIFSTTENSIVKSIELDAPPTGLALGPDAKMLYATVGIEKGTLRIIDLQKRKIKKVIKVGHSPVAPQVSKDKDYLYFCNRFSNKVAFFELKKNKVQTLVNVGREPVALSIGPNGKNLFVVNHLPKQPANSGYVSSSVSIVNIAEKTIKEILLPNGSTGARGIAISPDGKYAFVTHIIGRYTVPTTQLEQGWMNTNALSVIDISEKKMFNTVLLDDVHQGAANPWGVDLTDDGKHLVVSHSGTHELSVIETEKLISKLETHYENNKINYTDPYNILSYTYGFREKIKINGNGPRAITITGNKVFTADYFSGTLSLLNLESKRLKPQLISLGQTGPLSQQRTGEMFFNDASQCFQQWQSCASCHPDSRTDGLNWDLLNDGIGNPKNVKSMFLSHKTPPVMCTGIRPDAETAVRAGLKFIQFAVRPEEDAQAIDEYLKNMPQIPSPLLKNGKLSKSAKRGKKLFYSDNVGCIGCHPEPLFTDCTLHDVGTASTIDSTTNKNGERVAQLEYVTPTLMEVWRTAPYLHDGRYSTIKEVITEGNHSDMRGRTSHLKEQEIDDLVAFVKSL